MTLETGSIPSTARKAKIAASKGLEGYPGIFQELATEHDEVFKLMQRVAGSATGSSAREDLFPEIRRSLLAHAHAEDEEFYPVLVAFPELEKVVSVCAEEHLHIEEYLNELDSADKDSPTWAKLFERLMNAVEAHVEREEKEVFPRARELLTTEQAEEIAEYYGIVEQREKTQSW